MDAPESLPGRLYLLAYDTGGQRMTARSELGFVLRAGALTDLMLTGHLTDEGGRARATTAEGPGDPLLDAVLQQIAGSRPRSWQHWVNRQARRFPRQVRDQLAAQGHVRLDPHRVLGLFPSTRVSVRDTRVVKRLATTVSATLRNGRPVSALDPRDAALVALAAAGELKVVLPRPVRRAGKRRIEELSTVTGPVPRALRKAIAAAHAASS
jgi:hypothetical protein